MSDAFAYESVTVTGTAGGLTASTFFIPQHPATRALLTLETGEIRFRYDGTAPTASEGHLLEAGQQLELLGTAAIANFKAIRTTSTSGVLKVSYEA